MSASRAALVIGAHEFVDPRFQRLRSPSQDVVALADVLGDEAIGGFDVRTVVNQPSSEVQQELERFFSGRKPNDLLFLYFSCHGVKDPAGRLYFVTSNTTFDLLRSTGVSASFVSEQMEYSRSKRIVVLLDCCYSGAFLKGFRARGDDVVAVEQLEGRGRAVITASRATEYAFEADELKTENAQPSMFTGAVVDGLATGGADANGDGFVTVDELYDYVYDAVRGKVAGQTPGRWIDVEGDLVVARNPRPPVRAASLPEELERAIASDLALQRLGAVSELAQWHRSGDPERQLAAAPLLEALTRDYDERVKAAAAAALDLTPEPAPVVIEPIPLTAPTEPEQSTPPPSTPVAPPVSSAPEQSTPPPSVSSAPSAPPVSSEAPEAPAGRADRVAGLLAAIGGVAVLFAPYVDFLRYDGYSDQLGEGEWYTLGSFALFGLAAFAAFCILRAGRRATGHAVLLAVLPLALSEVLFVLERGSEDDVTGAGPGWVMQELGALLLVAAGVVGAVRLRRDLKLAPPTLRDRYGARASAITAAALLVGWAAALGWAQLVGLGGDGGFLDAVGAARALTLRLLVITAVVCFGSRWLGAHGATAARLAAGTAILVVLCVGLFLGDEEIRYGDDWLHDLQFVVLAVGAVAIPALATVVVPRRLGVVLLAAWVGSIAAWIPRYVAVDLTVDLLLAAVFAGGLLALAMHSLLVRRTHPV